MAEFKIPHNPINSLKREIRAANHSSVDPELLKTLIDSSIGNQHNVSQVMAGLTELLTILKGVDGRPDPEISRLEEKMNKILEQNYHLIRALNELTTHLKNHRTKLL